jgi:quercetin dioxygenase-like cupin family protein
MKVGFLNKRLQRDNSRDIQYQMHVKNTMPMMEHINYAPEEVAVNKGKIALQIEEETYQLTAGESILVPTGTGQQWSTADNTTDCILTFRLLEEDDFGNLLRYKKRQQKSMGNIRKIPYVSSYYETLLNSKKVSPLRVNALVGTCLKYLRMFKPSTLHSMLIRKIIKSKTTKYIT